MASLWGGRLRTGACITVLAVAVAWMFWPFVLDRAVVVERDALSYFLPRSAFLARALASGEIPGWNPAPVLGKPFFADWQSAALYPANLLLLVPPLSRGFNLLFVFHYLWAALGGFAWLRAKRLPRTSACLGAVVWSLGGTLLSLGHLFTLLMAAAWLPWVLLAWERPASIRRKIARAALVLALPLLTGAPEVILLISGALLLAARDARALLVPPLACAIAAAQILPTALYLGESHRAAFGLDPAVALRYSATPAELAQFFIHSGRLHPEPFLPSVYLGPVPCLLAALGFLAAERRTRLLLSLVLSFLVVLALGSNTPVLPALLTRVPGAALLRYPEKLLLGVHALLSAGAAFGAAALLAWMPRGRTLLAALLLGSILLDFGRVHRGLLATLPSQEVLEPPPVAQAILREARETPGAPIRYYAHSSGRPAAASRDEDAELDRSILFAATGELYGLADVNTPAAVNLLDHERLHRALGRLDLASGLRLLAHFGTRFVTSWSTIEVEGVVEPVALEAPSPRLFRLADPRPLALLATTVRAESDPDAALAALARAAEPGLAFVAIPEWATQVSTSGVAPQGQLRWIRFAPDHLELEVRVSARSLLVVNQTDSAGWHCFVDGAKTPIERVNALVQGVFVDSGEHRVEFVYETPGWRAGTVLSCLALLGTLLAARRGAGSWS